MNIEFEKISQFFNELNKNNTNDSKKKNLFSFAYQIETINFELLISNLQQSSITFFYWQKPDENQTIIAIDSLLQFEEYGEKRTELSQKQIEKWKNDYFSNLNQFDLDCIPLFLGGMKFSPEGYSQNGIWSNYADSDWFIPKNLLVRRDGNYYFIFNGIYQTGSESSITEEFEKNKLILNALISNKSISENEFVEFSNLHDENERSEWINKVNAALKEISIGDYSKIVLSRRVELSLSGQSNLFGKLKILAEDYPKCYIFAYRKDDSIFFGASPEKLAKIKNGWVEADALAGSTQRGKSEDEDKRLADELLLSKKNLSEQNAVVDFITNSFSGFSDEIVYEEKPIIRKLSNIQHLWTPIKAKLKEGHTIFSILKEIHPTPAICGVPWSGALDFIKSTEGYQRGLYAGIVGWFNFDEEGEFAVSIRSGLLKENKLYAFAGCGIVEGSDPQAEFEETELKLKPILSLFPDEKVIQS